MVAHRPVTSRCSPASLLQLFRGCASITGVLAPPTLKPTPQPPPAHKPFAAFIGVLQAEQQRQQLSDARFARLIGITGGYWYMLKSDGPNWRSPGTKLLLGALQAFPHTHPDTQNAAQPESCVACQLRDALDSVRDQVPIAQLLPAPAGRFAEPALREASA